MKESDVVNLLNNLVKVRNAIAVRTAPIDEQIKILEVQRKEVVGELATQETNLEKSAKSLVVAIGHTVKSSEYVNNEGLQAVWGKGRTSWDTDKLEGYIAGIQDKELQIALYGFKKVGSPSVSIRVAKQEVETKGTEDLF